MAGDLVPPSNTKLSDSTFCVEIHMMRPTPPLAAATAAANHGAYARGCYKRLSVAVGRAVGKESLPRESYFSLARSPPACTIAATLTLSSPAAASSSLQALARRASPAAASRNEVQHV